MHGCTNAASAGCAGAASYRIAFGPQAGRKAFALHTVSARGDRGSENNSLAKAAGFSLHVDVATHAHQRRKLERLCRYISRPALSTERVALTNQENIRYPLKTPYRDGTTHIVLEPLDLAIPVHPAPTALVPPCAPLSASKTRRSSNKYSIITNTRLNRCNSNPIQYERHPKIYTPFSHNIPLNAPTG